MFSMLITQKLSTHCIWRLNEPGRSVSESFFSYFYLGNVASGAFGTEVCGHSFSAAAQRSASLAWRAKDMCGLDWLTMCLVVPLHNPLQGGIYT